MPDITGSVVTADALHLHAETLDQVVSDHGADMLVGLKGNREKLLDEVAGRFAEASPAEIKEDFDECVGHGRKEERSLKIIEFKTNLKYPHIKSAIMVDRKRIQKKSGNTSLERSYYIATFEATKFKPGEVQALVREHWTIENRLHHVKDRNMMEDRCRAMGNVGANLGLLRSVAALMIQGEKRINKKIVGMLKGNSGIAVDMVLRNYKKAS